MEEVVLKPIGRVVPAATIIPGMACLRDGQSPNVGRDRWMVDVSRRMAGFHDPDGRCADRSGAADFIDATVALHQNGYMKAD